VHPLKDLLVIFDLYRQFKKMRPTVLHTHSSKAGIVGRIAGRLARVPVIIHTFHGFGFNDQQKPWVKAFYVALERFTARLSTKLIFVSESNREEALQKKIGDPSQYLVIRSGVPLKTIKERAANADADKVRTELGVPRDVQLITTVGPFKPQKNLMDFIRVAKIVTAAHPKSCFVAIGDGELRPQLEAQIKALGLEGRVFLPGWKENIPEILAASKIFCLTSLWEGLPRSMLEAMAAGRPSVCYETDGVKDLLRRGGGQIIPQKDTAAMAAAIEKLLVNENEWNARSLESKRLITSDFDIDVMVRQQEDLYASLLH
jgi:glycosyltransferase involved in cell wall biosynthesis